MRRGPRLLTLTLPLACLLGLGSACTKDQDAAPSGDTPASAAAATPTPAEVTTPTTPTTPTATAEVTTKLPPPTIKVLDPGQEPREPLRIAVEAGQRETMEMVMTMGMEMKMGALGAVPKIAMPPMAMTMGIHVTSISDSGDLRYEFELQGVDVRARPSDAPEVAEAMRQAIAGIVGMRGSSVISSRGEVREATFKMPQGAPDQAKQTVDSMQQSIQQIAVPFPEEPIGVGAKWEVTADAAEINGITMTQVSTYELLERKDGELTMATQVTQSAEPQEMKAPGLPPNTTIHLESMSSSGAGKTTLNLRRIAPTSGTIDLTSKTSMSVDSGGAKQAMSMDLDLSVEIHGR